MSVIKARVTFPIYTTELARKGLLLLLGLSIGGILSEILLRAFFPHLAPETAAITEFWQYDSLLGWSHIPRSSGRFNGLDFKTAVSINSKGFRDRERSYDRCTPKYRIVVLGDSMVWGYGVQQEEVFTASLEKQHEGIEVINLGVAGYGTDQELILLQQEGVRYRPDLIVLVFVENDFLTNVQSSAYSIHHKPMYTMSDDGRPSLTNIPVPTQRIWERAASRIIRHSFVLNITAGAYFTFKVESLFSSSTTRDSMKSLPFPRDPEERITVALLLEIQEVAKKIGADLLLVLADGMGARGREMENFFNSRHMRILNLDPSFPQEEAKQLHLADGEHWSALGHETVANRLVKYLEDENLSAGKDSWPKRCCC